MPVFRVLYSVFRRPGGHSGGIPPDPIPNSAVKASCAYGTAAQAAGESVAARPAKDGFRNQTPPTHQKRKPPCVEHGGFLLFKVPAVFARTQSRYRPLCARFGRRHEAEDDMAKGQQRSNR